MKFFIVSNAFLAVSVLVLADSPPETAAVDNVALTACSDGFFETWKECVTSAENCPFCSTDAAPSECTEVFNFMCHYESCCPSCADKIPRDGFTSCVADAGCELANCNIAESEGPVVTRTMSSCAADYHGTWEECVSANGCNFCSTDESPDTCESYSTNVCGFKTCCAACTELITGEYMECAESVGCVTPNCNIMESDGDNNNDNDAEDTTGSGANVAAVTTIAIVGAGLLVSI